MKKSYYMIMYLIKIPSITNDNTLQRDLNQQI